jgi:hypothetical protein
MEFCGRLRLQSRNDPPRDPRRQPGPVQPADDELAQLRRERDQLRRERDDAYVARDAALADQREARVEAGSRFKELNRGSKLQRGISPIR